MTVLLPTDAANQGRRGEKVSASLTRTLIQQRYLEKWDGKLPQFSAGGNTPGIFLNVPAPPAGKP